MKLINYRCKNCHHEEEVIYQDSEEIPDKLDTKCKVCCGTKLEKYNFKNNQQVWKFMDAR